VRTPRRTMAARKGRSAAGFTLIEVMVSIVVLTVGLVSLLGVFGLAMATTQSSQEDLIAKQLASEAMESIITARGTTQLSWNQIQNVGAGTNPDGIFLTGAQPIDLPGSTYGVVGTSDNGGPETLRLPGPDGIVGTADDVILPLTNYTRQIQISAVTDGSGNISTDLRSVTITVSYQNPRLRTTKNFILNSYISEYR
jgi:prepilin-type N-terminal cleavage/methylation domain-containing protein